MRVDLRSISEAVAVDPVQALFDRAGPLTDYEIFHNLVLVATYVEPPKIMKGPKGENITFHLTDRSLSEVRFQGKVGLVLKCGPQAFIDDKGHAFGGVIIAAGDWVVYNPSDGVELFIKDYGGAKNDGLSCRLIEDIFIKGRVSDPSLIY